MYEDCYPDLRRELIEQDLLHGFGEQATAERNNIKRHQVRKIADELRKNKMDKSQKKQSLFFS